jgi:signal peptide peptidase SppA
LEALAPAIEKAFALKNLSAVALEINSPGGSPVQSDLIAGRIRALAEEKHVPVFSFCEDVAASGGYWLACAADEIFVMPGSIIGSIGVVSSGFGFVEAIGKLGIERRVYTAGEQKAILDPFKPENTEDVKTLKRIQADLHDQFTGWVKERRGDRLTQKRKLFTGSFWTGREAIPLGLADGSGNLRQIMRERFGEEVQFRATVRLKSQLQRLFGMDMLVDHVIARLEEYDLRHRLGL